MNKKKKHKIKPVVLFGNSSSTILAYFELMADPDYIVSGFTVDEAFITENRMFDLPVVPFNKVETYFSPKTHYMFIPIGYMEMNRIREKKYIQAKKKKYLFISCIHPSAVIYPEVSVGENCLIGPHAVIQPGAKIGNNVIIRENCRIGHNNNIQDHCFIAGHSNISGNVTIESYCFLGANSTIKNRVIIRKESLIGAGVTILNDTGEKDVYMSRPAQKLPFPSDKFKF